MFESSQIWSMVDGDLIIFKLTTEILNATNNKLLAGWIFCDLEKAFDCVGHDILLCKLKFYRINSKDFAFQHSYPDNRYFGTAIHNDSDNSNKSYYNCCFI